MADVKGLFDRLNTFADYQRAEEEFQAQKQLLGLKAKSLARGGDLPSNIQEWNAYQQMDPVQREEYLRMKRADQVLNLGGTMGVRNPLGGGLIEEYTVTPKITETPEYNAQVAGAESAAKLGQELQLAPQIEQEKTIARLAGEASGAATKKTKQAGETIEKLDRAEQLLGNVKGGALDVAGMATKRVLGGSDLSTQSDEQLKLLSGWLVANVPRMEGPQSNFDVQNYQKMAADLGNSMKPAGDRIAALQELRALQQKYTGQDPLSDVDVMGAAAGNMPGMKRPDIVVTPSMPKGGVGEIEFKLKKSGFTTEQIKEYKKARGIQ